MDIPYFTNHESGVERHSKTTKTPYAIHNQITGKYTCFKW